MIRIELARKLADEIGISRRKADKIILMIFEEIISGLCKDGLVSIHNFGSFMIRERKAKIFISPIDKKKYKTPIRKSPRFTPSKKLLELINRH